MTPLLWLSTMVESGEMEKVESTQLDASQPLLWMAGTRRENDVLYRIASWSAPDGRWLFTVVARTARIRTDLVHSFVEACKSVG